MTGRRATFDLKDLEKVTEAVNNQLNPIEYLAIDPGKYNGICGYDPRMYLQFMFVVDAEDMPFFLTAFKKIKICIYENWKLFPQQAAKQVYSDMQASQIIGQIKSWGKLNQVELVEQPPSIKPTGYKWIGKKPPPKSSNKNDTTDAHVHFMYWAVRNGKIPASRLLRTIENDSVDS